MTTQLGRLPEWLEYFAAVARTYEGKVTPFKGDMLNVVQRVPLGVVGQITPWNHPLLIAVKKIAPALAAGNSVVVKPSELAPVCVLEFAKLCQKAGLPDGVLNVVAGRGSVTGKALSESKKISKIEVLLKEGMISKLIGKAPVIVFDDCDLTSAVNGAAFAAFIAAGQTCVMGSRVIVTESIHDEFVKRLTEKAGSLKLGDSLDPTTQMGPVISRAQRDRVERLVSTFKPEGLTVTTGGKRPPAFPKGYFYEPTVIVGCKPTSTLAQDEVFGPVVVVIKVKDEQEAIENDPSSPWGGMKESGIGRENGIEAYEEYTESKSLVINYGGFSDWFSARNARYG
ncbi:hypothetical protein HDU96_006837 [Phlyctochytrium bullatum]|nr:hypothetical protein HDU96_006837 [Phlyctochytrium bullatum]